MFLPSVASLVATTLFCSIASTSPAKLTKKNNFLPYVPQSQHSKRFLGNIGDYGENNLPACDKDPSYATGQSRFGDGQGYLQASTCDNEKGGNGQCWTDTFIVHWNYETENWKSTGNAVDCTGSSECAQENVDLNKTCTTFKITEEGSLKATFELKLPQWIEGWNPSFDFHKITSENNLATEEVCTTTSSRGSCTWNDEGCWAIWAAQRNRQIWGYQRRTCRTPRKGTHIADSPPRSDGLYTVGMQDFSIAIPDGTQIGCGASCNDLTYPSPPPPAPTTVEPVQP